jgi:hypothetical protein
VKRFVRSFLGIAVGAVLAFVAMPALANAGLHITLTVPSQATAGVAIPFTYTSVGVPARGRLVVQRQMGTRHVYQTVATLRRVRIGQSALAPLPLGVYTLRIAVIVRRRVIPDPRASLSVFGQVPFSTLFNTSSSGVYTTQSRTFAYVLSLRDDGSPPPALSVTRNNCRAIHFDFVPGNETYPAPETATITVVQETLDPQSASAAIDAFGSLDARLIPGQAWSINTSAAGQPDGFNVFANGSASCDSAAPANG